MPNSTKPTFVKPTLEQRAEELTEMQRRAYQGNYVGGRAEIKNGAVVSVKVFNWHDHYKRNLNQLTKGEIK